MSSDLTPADYRMAMLLVDKSGAYITDLMTTAAELGATINLGQVIGALLGVSLAHVARPITREEFNVVYDVFENQFSEALAVMQAELDYGSGPEATGDAQSPAHAREMRDHWGEVIDAAAWDLGLAVSPEGMAEWEADLLGGKLPTVGESEPTDG